jgi:hypothetical protein
MGNHGRKPPNPQESPRSHGRKPSQPGYQGKTRSTFDGCAVVAFGMIAGFLTAAGYMVYGITQVLS